MIDISGFDKADVLAALYNASKPQGLGFLHFEPSPMTTAQARELIDEIGWPFNQMYFDYIKGRVMKVDLGANEFNPWLYDRDNGEGAASRALAHLESRKS